MTLANKRGRLQAAAEAITYCVDGARANMANRGVFGGYEDPTEQDRLLEVAVGCRRDCEPFESKEIQLLRATFAGTSLEKHPSYQVLTSTRQ